MFSRDEMQRAIEDALKSMEGVALELYRRGREPLLEELEEARARNADMRTMLEQVTRERDEARAEVERVRKHYAASVLEHGKMLVEAVDSAKRQKSLADRAHDQACRLAAKLDARSTDQFRRGAEAMREACARWIAHKGGDERIAWQVGRLPIPEEP